MSRSTWLDLQAIFILESMSEDNLKIPGQNLSFLYAFEGWSSPHFVLYLESLRALALWSFFLLQLSESNYRKHLVRMTILCVWHIMLNFHLSTGDGTYSLLCVRTLWHGASAESMLNFFSSQLSSFCFLLLCLYAFPSSSKWSSMSDPIWVNKAFSRFSF